MPVSLNNTQVVFNDATTQTTAGVTSVGAGTGISSSGGLTPTITNTGVTSAVAGTGVSVSGATGAVTFTNSGVTSIVAGTGISISGGTGAVTVTNTASVSASELARAWVKWNSSGTVIKAFNVSSVSVRGTGQWTVNFTSALPDANYTMAGMATFGPIPFYPNCGGMFVNQNQNTNPTTTACEINTTFGTRNGADGGYSNANFTSVVFFD
jgi:hypothetical protein